MKKYELSIIIPCYNCAQWIERTINSIIEQECLSMDYEIILINDGSTDNTYSFLIENFGNNPKIKIFTKKNGGVSSARNYGLCKSSKEFVTFIDSDDTVDEKYLLTLEEMLKNESDLYIFGIRRIVNNRIEKNKIPAKKSNYLLNRDVKNIIMKEMINSPCNKIYVKRIIEKNNIKFNEKYEIAEDYLFNMEYLSKCKKIYGTNKILYNYYLDSNVNSLTKKEMKSKYTQLNEIDSKLLSNEYIAYHNEINYIALKHTYSFLIQSIIKNENNQIIFEIIKKIKGYKVINLKTFLLIKIFPTLPISIIKLIIKSIK